MYDGCQLNRRHDTRSDPANGTNGALAGNRLIGTRVTGWPIMTISRGEIVYRDGEVLVRCHLLRVRGDRYCASTK